MSWWFAVLLGSIFPVGEAWGKPGGPELRWEDDEVRRYVFKAEVTTPNALPMWAVENIDGLILGFRIDLVTSCRPAHRMGKRGVELRCDVEDASIQGRPDPGTQGKVAQVAQEWTELLKGGGWVQMDVMRNGRVRRVGLQGLAKGTPREQLIHQVMREMIVRAVAPMDVLLPKKGFEDKKPWRQRDSLVLGLPSIVAGSVGGAWLNLEWAADTPAGRLVAIRGRGTLGWGMEQGDNLRDMMSMEFDGSFVFDEERGILRQAQHVGEGEPTAGSAQTTAKNVKYLISASAQWLPEDDAAPTLPEPGELGVSPTSSGRP